MTDTLLPRGESYADVYARFRWPIPTAYNIAVDVCDRHATDRSRVALVYEDDAGCVSEHTFAEFRARSNQFARALTTLGVARGDRVGIVLPQRPETAVAHLAAYKLGAVALPLSTLFGPDALEYRLRDAGAKVVVTDGENLERVLAVAKGLPALVGVVCVDRADADGVVEYAKAIDGVSDSLEPVATAAEDPALLIYTSGTTGPPKGALHAHRVLLGHLPSIEFYHEYFPKPGDRHWSPADWAWAGGLLDVLLPSWHYGVTVVAHRPKKFDAERAFEILARHRVRNTFLVPTMLKMMRSVGDPRGRWRLELRSMFTGGEAVGEEVIRWAREALGVTPHEGFGQTEVNLGLVPGAGGTQRLVRMLGQAKAKELVLLGLRLTSDEAAAIGLVTKTVENEAFSSEVREFAGRLARQAPIAIRLAKALLNRGGDTPIDAALEMEAMAFGLVASTDDIYEGIQAFMEKRAPKFKGT